MEGDMPTIDPMERIIESALTDAKIRFQTGQGGQNPSGLDFLLPDIGIEIEVKQFHSDRIGTQMAKAPNVIAAQGRDAVEFLASLIRGRL